MEILVTGGTGYIGSHTAVELINTGARVILADNLCNSKAAVAGAIEKITGTAPVFYEGDVRSADFLNGIFSRHKIDAVMHFAGLKAVGESQSFPLEYYDNNVTGTMNLLRAIGEHGVNKLIFSSSATVYGEPKYLPYDESHPTAPQNTYGSTKLCCELLIKDYSVAHPGFRAVSLRYFNPVGAHASGLIGEDPTGTPNNLMPFVTAVARKKAEFLKIFGNDYPTRDGTGVRDYLHVTDLALGHVAALEYIERNSGYHVFNLGTGTGYSVSDVVREFESACGVPVPYKFYPRRPGDLAEYFANADRAQALLGWTARRSLADMCSDAYRFALSN